tara:strand:+ start:798 stop:1028 length:231 start_codon:yes stop_codon:yes gene_type:complete
VAEDKKGDEFDDDPIRKYFRRQQEKADSNWDWRSDRRSRFLCRKCDKETMVTPGFPPAVCSYCGGRAFDYKGGWYV